MLNLSIDFDRKIITVNGDYNVKELEEFKRRFCGGEFWAIYAQSPNIGLLPSQKMLATVESYLERYF